MRFSKQELHQIFNQMYKEKKQAITIAEICKKFKIGQPKLHENILAVNGYEDCPDVFTHIKKPIHNFDNINEESAYWIGYLIADGCLTTTSKGTSERLMLECKTSDKEILEKFCEFLGIRKERITIGHKGASRALSMTTKIFTTSLKQYGIIKNKSHKNIKLPEFSKNNENLFFQFLRGLIDGDGTIHTYQGSYGISFVTNSLQLATDVKNELQKYLPEPTSIWIMEKTKEQQKNKNATQSLFTLKIGSGIREHSNLKYIYHKFYDNQKIILTRKQQAFKKIL